MGIISTGEALKRAQEVSMDPQTRQRLLTSAALLSLVAAVIHVWVMPEHFEEW